MDLEEYKRTFNDESTPGWDAINDSLTAIYGDQEPSHWGTLISYRLGGPDPLDGISAYSCRDGGVDHLHFVTYGFSNLYYDEEAVGGHYSSYGFEMTFRLASPLPPDEDQIWVCSLLQNLARYVFDSGNWFDNYHWIPANGPIRADYETDIVGLAFLFDPKLPGIDTPHGRVEFIQAFGITKSELESLLNKTRSCEEIVEQHRQSNPLLITDLARRNA